VDVAQPILPFAHELVLCEDYSSDEMGRIDLLGTFRSIRPESYPYTHSGFLVVAQLSGGLGQLSTFVDVRLADTEKVVYWTAPQVIAMQDRNALVYLLNILEDVPFPRAGVYFVELYCENTCIADYRLHLLETVTEQEEEGT
jgi:hypothetical protein